MSKNTMETVMTMSEEDLEELQKNIKKRMIKKFIMNVATGVVVHFAVGFVINMIESKRNEQEEIEE